MQIGLSFLIWLRTKSNYCKKLYLQCTDLGFFNTYALKLYSCPQWLLRITRKSRTPLLPLKAYISRNTQLSEMQQKSLLIKKRPASCPATRCCTRQPGTRSHKPEKQIHSPPHIHNTLCAGLNKSGDPESLSVTTLLPRLFS